MKHLVEFAVRIGYLPRRRWFYRAVMSTLWVEASPRDSGQIGGWITVAPFWTPQAFQNFHEWFDYCSKRWETAGDRSE